MLLFAKKMPVGIPRTRSVLCCACLCMVLSTSMAWAQSSSERTGYSADLTHEMQRLADELVMDNALPGITVSVLMKGDDKPFTVSAGLTCVENPVPMHTSSILRIGSVTKAFTATRIGMLVEEGKLSYSTPLSRFYPDFPDSRNITIVDLLSHSSGVHEFLALPAVWGNMSKPWTPDELIEMVEKMPLDFQPGTEQRYSNTGYLILAKIIEAITGESYGQQIQDHVMKPLGMRHSGVASDIAITPNASCGYSVTKDGNLRQPFMASIAYPVGTGNLQGTTEDMVRLVNQGRLMKSSLIENPPTTHKNLPNGTSPVQNLTYGNLKYTESYQRGMVLFLVSEPHMLLIGKDGMFPGFAAWFLYDQKTQMGLAVAVNQEAKLMDAFALAVKVFQKQRERLR